MRMVDKDMLFKVLPVFVFVPIFILFIFFVKFYLKLRKNRLVNVNCWFCNQWVKVGYENKNSWYCPTCEQYNGFTKDGDYNKLIPEQHDEFLNKRFPCSTPRKSVISDNGLCNNCNRKQNMKVKQLAMFSPIEEHKFDEEIDKYQKQLERVYQVCSQCEITVKRTIQQQKSIYLGMHLRTSKKSKSESLNTANSKKRIVFNAIKIATVLIAIFHIYNILLSYNFFQLNIVKTLPDVFSQYALVFKDFYVFTNEMINSVIVSFEFLISVVSDVLKLHEIELSSFLNPVTGLSLQFVYFIFNKPFKNHWELTKCFIWLFLNIPMNLKIIEFILCCFIVVASYFDNKLIIKNETLKLCNNKEEFFDKTFEVSNLNHNSNQNCQLNKTKSTFDTAKSVKSLNVSTNTYPVFGQQASFENVLNTSFLNSFSDCSPTFKLSESDSFSKFNVDNDLDKSLRNLHLDTESFVPHNASNLSIRSSTPTSSNRRPILYPSKLQNVQNTWTAGGYWKPTNLPHFGTLSRSSSQSSGFGSQSSQVPNYDNVFGFPQTSSSRTNSICGDFDRQSVFSEPVFRSQSQMSYRKPENNFHCQRPFTSDKNPFYFHINSFSVRNSYLTRNSSFSPPLNSPLNYWKH